MYLKSHVRAFPHTATQAAFLLGGIGTGNISVGSRGELRDWEIFNRPAKGLKLPYSFFAIQCRSNGGQVESFVRVLEAPIQPPYAGSQGLLSGSVAGLPHMQSSQLQAEYPFVTVAFRDETLPVSVTLEAFTPFIPLNSDDSGLPGCILRYRVSNTGKDKLSVSIAGSLPNAVGFSHFDPFGNIVIKPGAKNEYREEEDLRGLSFSSIGFAKESLEYGSMALVTTDEHPSFKQTWLDGGWFDGIQDFWDDFREDGRLSAQSSFGATSSRITSNQQRPLVGSLCVTKDIEPGTEAAFAFIISWSFPNRPRT